MRTLLSKGRSYEQAVEAFEPYEKTREPNEAAREAMRRVAERAMQRKKPAFVFDNNRLEGHAPAHHRGGGRCQLGIGSPRPEGFELLTAETGGGRAAIRVPATPLATRGDPINHRRGGGPVPGGE